MAATVIPAPVTAATAAATTAGQSTMSKVLSDAELVLSVLAGVGSAIPGIGIPIAAGAAIALKIESVIAAAINAHQAITGQPIDLTKLQPYVPI